jgi:hypothetical protein
MSKPSTQLWLSRLLIAIVTGWNLQCAAVFLIAPTGFAAGFELDGVPGAAAVRGLAVLFVMWNVPYLVALWHPQRYTLALALAVAMQFVGLAGESFILSTLPAEYAILRGSIWRFIWFDGAGLPFLLAAWMLVKGRNHGRDGQPG